MTARKLVVVSGGLSEPSMTRMLADRLAATTARFLASDGVEPTVRVIELRDHARDVTNQLLTGFASDPLREATGAVAGADALIAVTPIFNGSYGGVFKSFFDVLDTDALAGTPVLIGATGGTPRHSLALEFAVRPMFAHLRAIVAPTAVYAAAQDWGDPAEERALADRIESAGRDFAAAVAGRPPDHRAGPYDDVTPFEQLLGPTEPV